MNDQPPGATPCFEGTFQGYRVEVLQDLCWAVIIVNGTAYESYGLTSPFWLYTYDDEGHESVTPLDRLLQMIRMNADPDKLGKEARAGHESWLYNEGRPLVAGYRKAHAKAKWFCEHEAPYVGSVREQILRRWKTEKVEPRAMKLRCYLNPEDRAAMGLPRAASSEKDVLDKLNL